MGPRFNPGDFVTVYHIDNHDRVETSSIVVLRVIPLDTETNDYLFEFYSSDGEAKGKHNLLDDNFTTFVKVN